MPHRFDIPKSFGPFELMEKVGRGGTATVYKGRARDSGQIVAVKIGARLLSLDEGNFDRFKREFTVIRHLRHPHLVGALDFGEEKQVPFLVLEFVDGQTLEKHLQNEGPLPIARALPIILQVAAGLRFLHQKQVLHRDVKPGNIFLDAQGQAKLGDFGLLKLLTSNTTFTRPRQAMGTLEYGAPEQFEDAKFTDFRCDVYSLAATLYTALTGLFPFGAGSQLRILQRKLQNKFMPLQRVLPTIAHDLAVLVARSMDAKRERRPATIDEFMNTLTKINDALPAAPARLAPVQIPDSGPGAERRAQVRLAVKLPAAFVPFHQHKRGSWQATVLDVSAGGLRLRTSTNSPVNTLLEVTVAGKGNSYLAQVRWVKTTQEQEFILGCSFVRPLEPAEIEEIIPSRGKPAGSSGGLLPEAPL